MEQLLNQGIQDIVMALGGLLFAYATLLISKAKAKADAETSKIKNEDTRKLVQDAIDRVDDLVLKAVSATNQTVVTDLKAQIALGLKNKGDLLALGEKVATDVYTQLKPSTIELLSSEIVDVKSYITNSVEAQVLNLKSTTITQVTPLVTTTVLPVQEVKPIPEPVIVATDVKTDITDTNPTTIILANAEPITAPVVDNGTSVVSATPTIVTDEIVNAIQNLVTNKVTEAQIATATQTKADTISGIIASLTQA